MRKECAHQVVASGLHRYFPDCLLTNGPPPIFVASGRPLAGASNIANGMPCVIPPMVARRVSFAAPAISPGIEFFVSGMYRDNARQHAPIIEWREAMPEKADERGPRGRAQGGVERMFHT
ncbi:MULTISPECIES: hypothetical protein [unclassified Burkholderia]|uniref:hypothetical protein n=1 Tax=unclassified Burkholderia TaxID=2613784 RepID=UPI000F570569|nr:MULTISPECIES: hypothetical protein [unclassified Burkholderia]